MNENHCANVFRASHYARVVFATLFGAAFAFLPPSESQGQDLTVKTNHHNVNLWSQAGREGGEQIGEIERYEEVQVLDSKKLANGEIWYRVQLRRFPNEVKTELVGWVDSKFFTRIEDPVDDDQPADNETEASACTDCAAHRTAAPLPKKQIQDISSIVRKTKSGFVWPVRGSVRSGFGYRKHPIKRVVKLHRGTDIAGNAGAAVQAAKAGVVEISAGGCKTGRKRCNGGAGNMVTINHGDGTKTRYFHLSPKCKLPRKGTRVAQREIIGCVGATGAVTGPHLHFEVLKNGKWINPLTVLPRRRT